MALVLVTLGFVLARGDHQVIGGLDGHGRSLMYSLILVGATVTPAGDDRVRGREV